MEDKNSINKIDKILDFLPYFEDVERSRYTVVAGSADPYCYSSEVDHFITTIYKEGFLQEFDWMGWDKEASKYIENPSLIDTADIETLQKLLTTHVRAERLCGGHLAQMIDSGHILAILRRFKVIQNSLTN